MNELLKIGDVSRITGLAPETIRYYERQGILSPDKDKGNGYRYYSTTDVYSIIRIRAYMKLGFSMSQAHRLITGASVEEVESALLERAEELQKSITEQMLLLQTIYRRMRSIQSGLRTMGSYCVRRMPAMLALSMYDKEKRLDLSLPQEAWYNRQDITYPYCVFGLDEADRVYIDRMGMCVTEEECGSAELLSTANDRLEACPCLHTCTIVRDSDTLRRTQEIADYLCAHYPDTARRVVIHRTLAALDDGKDNAYFVEFWMPLTRGAENEKI